MLGPALPFPIVLPPLTSVSSPATAPLAVAVLTLAAIMTLATSTVPCVPTVPWLPGPVMPPLCLVCTSIAPLSSPVPPILSCLWESSHSSLALFEHAAVPLLPLGLSVLATAPAHSSALVIASGPTKGRSRPWNGHTKVRSEEGSSAQLTLLLCIGLPPFCAALPASVAAAGSEEEDGVAPLRGY